MYLASIFNVLHAHPILLYVLVGMLGLVIGSFLALVAYRLPIIMHRQWQSDVIAFINEQPNVLDEPKRAIRLLTDSSSLSLSYPRSHCDSCHQALVWYDMVPVISFLWLKGRCRHCHARIYPHHLITEMATAILSILAIWQLGMTPQGLLSLIFIWFLVVLASIDWQTKLLPDRLTLPLAMIGLAVGTLEIFTPTSSSVWGVLMGFGVLWAINACYKLIKRIDGMGLGDAKLLAAIGGWLGVGQLPLVIFIACVFGLLAGLINYQKLGKSTQFAFGPYLAMGGGIGMLWGEQILAWYLG
ncbi:A24 family peptidase [Moraxella nasovis]|uniref:prepilin peptidase n=1 Tax=Moraxella nasovis TaxID=2904121 RepID=UPI001F605670|nr:A24 family peptidase [Moraxella nasovis]UNU74303.1 A24 family peptidase [Moraxella nasovis]